MVRHAVFILRGEGARKGAILRAVERHLHRVQRPAQIRRQHGHNQTGADDDAAGAAHHRLQHPRHGRIRQRGDFCAWQHAQRQHGNGDVERQRNQDAKHSRQPHIAAFARVRGKHRRAFHAGEYPQRNQHGVFHLGQRRRLQPRAVPVGGKGLATEKPQREADKKQKRENLDQRRHQIDRRRFLDAARGEPIHRPDNRRLADKGGGRVALAEKHLPRRIGEAAERLKRDDKIAGNANGGAEPIAPGGEKADQLAKTVAGVGVNAAVQRRPQPRQIPERKTEGDDTDAGNHPADDERFSARHLRHILRQAKNAGSNHRA